MARRTDDTRSHRRRPPFAGQAGELAALATELERARGGELRVVLLTGEAGIGKTALAREAGVGDAVHGMAVGDGSRLGTRDPHLPQVVLLRGAHRGHRGAHGRPHADDDELVANAQKHMREAHPDMAGKLTREQILGMAKNIA